jgi:hypothetical protein
MVEKRKKQYYGVTLDPVVAERCKELAKDDNRSFSYYVNQVLEQELLRMGELVDEKPPKDTRPYKFWKVFEPDDDDAPKYTKDSNKIGVAGFLTRVSKAHVGNQYPFNQRDKLEGGETADFMDGMTYWKNKIKDETIYLIEYYGAIYIFRHIDNLRKGDI